MQQAGKLMMMGGAFILVVGIVLWAGSKYLHWFGHLPGDVSIERDKFKLFMPLTSMLLVSFILSVIVWIFRKYLQ